MKKSGYLLVRDAAKALELIDEPGVRYAARFEDGSGFAAFDVKDRVQLHAMTRFGEVLIAEPDYPDSWPDWARKAAPKRGLAQGDERFALIRPRTSSVERCLLDVMTLDIRGAVLVMDGTGRPGVLVEFGPECEPVFEHEMVWAQAVVEYRDARQEAGV